jgi:hypothetical protein
MMAAPRNANVNRLIARILIAKPHASLADVRRLVPELADASDALLTQKLNSLSGRARNLAPAAQAEKPRRRKQ